MVVGPGLFWAQQPTSRVTHLSGVTPEAVRLALDPLPADAPAVVTCDLADLRLDAPGAPVAALLAELEQAVIALFPAWLAGAHGLDGPQGARVAAVRALAATHATRPHLGAYLGDLAARALGNRPRPDRFPAETRAAGLAQAIAGSYRRSRAALLIQVRDPLGTSEAERAVAAGEWLAHHGGFTVWLVGDAAWPDRLRSIPAELPSWMPDLPPGVPEAGAGRIAIAPPVAGRPTPGSAAEQALEAALAQCPWAHGRVWNQTFRTDPLAEEIRVDLMWRAERVAVEVDGDEHRGALHYERDRRRDVRLQLAGYAVLRFTNRQVAQELAVVLRQLEQLLTTRRQEGIHHVRH